MKNLPLPIDEQMISQQLGRTIKSPIYIAKLDNVGIDQKKFIKTFSPFFAQLPWDLYDPKKVQIELLEDWFPDEKKEIHEHFKPYFLGQESFDALQSWTERLNSLQLKQLQSIEPWRRRSVSNFRIKELENGELHITRHPVPKFIQDVDDSDYRSWPRVFQEAPAEHVENKLFKQFLTVAFRTMQKARKNIGETVSKAKIVVHFMSVKSTTDHPGDNSPEGAHEDGADYIVSALVINRINIIGGESQIIEQLKNGQKDIIYSYALQPGEFIFQADSQDQHIYGTDLWHHVTPFAVDDLSKGEGWRDIIGFDINIWKED